jgi:hypothetical protein
MQTTTEEKAGALLHFNKTPTLKTKNYADHSA